MEGTRSLPGLPCRAAAIGSDAVDCDGGGTEGTLANGSNDSPHVSTDTAREDTRNVGGIILGAVNRVHLRPPGGGPGGGEAATARHGHSGPLRCGQKCRGVCRGRSAVGGGGHPTGREADNGKELYAAGGTLGGLVQEWAHSSASIWLLALGLGGGSDPFPPPRILSAQVQPPPPRGQQQGWRAVSPSGYCLVKGDEGAASSLGAPLPRLFQGKGSAQHAVRPSFYRDAPSRSGTLCNATWDPLGQSRSTSHHTPRAPLWGSVVGWRKLPVTRPTESLSSLVVGHPCPAAGARSTGNTQPPTRTNHGPLKNGKSVPLP